MFYVFTNLSITVAKKLLKDIEVCFGTTEFLDKSNTSRPTFSTEILDPCEIKIWQKIVVVQRARKIVSEKSFGV